MFIILLEYLFAKRANRPITKRLPLIVLHCIHSFLCAQKMYSHCVFFPRGNNIKFININVRDLYFKFASQRQR